LARTVATSTPSGRAALQLRIRRRLRGKLVARELRVRRVRVVEEAGICKAVVVCRRGVEMEREIVLVLLDRIDEGDLAFVEVVACLALPPVIRHLYGTAYEPLRPFRVVREVRLRRFRHRHDDRRMRAVLSHQRDQKMMK